MSDTVQVAIEDAIAHIQINRPEKKNALTIAMYAALADALRRAESDDSVRVVLFSGAESAFCAGNDLSDFLQAPPIDESSPAFQFLHVLASAQKPLVAAVRGVAIGIGVTMLLHCDLVYAGRGARFQLPFVNLGLVPEAGSSLLLPQMLGHRGAAALLMLGDAFDADAAHAAGIVNAVVPDGEVLPIAQVAAHALAAKAPEALRLTKQLMKSHNQPALNTAMTTEARIFSQRLTSAEATEAFQAFFERRKPDFSQFK